jgi:putative ABC transport system substrate-binding protein
VGFEAYVKLSLGLEGDEMRRREFITVVGGAVVALPLVALAQKAGRTYRLGCLSMHPRDIPFNVLFFDKLRRAGFIEGQNLAINYLAYAAHIDLISQYAAELVIAQPDVIYAAGAVAILAVQQATKSIPIVGIARDMVVEGLVESFARPNGNTTGISMFYNELDGKRQDILIEAMPGIRRMAALAETSLLTEAKARALQEAARANNVELLIYRITTAEEIAATIDKAKSSGATALNVLASPMLDGNVPHCAFRPSINGRTGPRQVALSATVHPSISWKTLLPDLRRAFCAAPYLPICRSNSRRNSSW